MKPTNLAFRLKMAQQTAEAYLRDNGLSALPIDPFAIAAKHELSSTDGMSKIRANTI